MTKLIFFGTQHFGTGILTALLECGEYNIVGVVTQPDRAVGRNQEVEFPPAKKYALDHGLNVFQPESLKAVAEQKFLPVAEVAVVCQYGLIIPQSVLDLFPQGIINVHTSLLPAYRGASPVQSALINGETMTGVTIMQMDAKMDHGPILSQGYINIDKDDTYPTLSATMLPVAENLLVRTLRDLLNGNVKPTEQIHEQATFCKMLNREDGKLDFTKTSAQLYNLYRGTYPWPGVWTMWEGKRLKIQKTKPNKETITPGKVAIKDDMILIGCSQGSLNIEELQLEGKKPMTATQFISGYKNINGAMLQ